MWTLVYFSAQARGAELAGRYSVVHSAGKKVDRVWERERENLMEDDWDKGWEEGRGERSEVEDGQAERPRDGGRADVIEVIKGGRGRWEEGRGRHSLLVARQRGRTNEHWGFSEPYRKRIRDGWIHTLLWAREDERERHSNCFYITVKRSLGKLLTCCKK